MERKIGRNSSTLSGSWISGTYNSTDYSGLSASLFYNDGSLFGSAGVLGDINVTAFASVAASPYDVFFSGANVDFLLNLSEFFDFVPSLDSIAAELVGGNPLPDFDGSAQGEIFRVVNNEFIPIPEPSTAVLLMMGFIGLATARRGRLASRYENRA